VRQLLARAVAQPLRQCLDRVDAERLVVLAGVEVERVLVRETRQEPQTTRSCSPGCTVRMAGAGYGSSGSGQATSPSSATP
jgi:hypothetical protein